MHIEWECAVHKRIRKHIAHLRQQCHNSKFGIFELLVQKETSADALLQVGPHL